MIPDSIINAVAQATIVINLMTAVFTLAVWVGAYAFDLAEQRMR